MICECSIPSYCYFASFSAPSLDFLFSSNQARYMVILHLTSCPPMECICSPPLPLHPLLLFISHPLCSFVIFLPTVPQLVFLSLCFSLETLSSPPPCASFQSTHQSLALASPLRTYGMMDRRASGASKSKGHLPGAQRCRGAQGQAMQPRAHTSVFKTLTLTHTKYTQQHLL